jgi:hypothetical protein
MKPFLMGTETEYAVSGRTPRSVLPPEEVYNHLNDALRKERLWLPDVNGGRAVYLQNGGRFYMDSGGHPEYATPEAFSPTQVAAYDKAGERLLEVARARAQAEHPLTKIAVAKNNVGATFADRVVWGCHESYTSWAPADRVGVQLMPHLVSRMIYAGAGSLSARANGMGFELSQRARHLVLATGSETTSNRAIFCTRIRKAADYAKEGWTRIHLICKDSQRAPFGIYLTFGTTGLLQLLMNEGRVVGRGLQLADPVAAVQTIALDPWLRARVPLADGRKLTALEIQGEYLAECERAVRGGDFPDWVPDVLRHWEATLVALAGDPLALAGRLDPYCKLLIFDHEVRRAGYTWGDLHAALRILELQRASFTPDVIRALLAETPSALPAETQSKYGEAMILSGANQPGVLDRLRFAVRLHALELSYHEVGGLYDQLVGSRRFDNVILTPAEVEEATLEPPPGGRAAIRGACVKANRESGWVCDWRYLFHQPSGRFVDLRDAFETKRRIITREQFPGEDRADVDLVEMYNRLTGRR